VPEVPSPFSFRQQPLVQVAVWCIGEYGELLVAGPIETKDKTFITVSYITS